MNEFLKKYESLSEAKEVLSNEGLLDEGLATKIELEKERVLQMALAL